MPFTLVGQLLRNFIFGKIMCKLIPYCQGKHKNIVEQTIGEKQLISRSISWKLCYVNNGLKKISCFDDLKLQLFDQPNNSSTGFLCDGNVSVYIN
jgi:hypothetical protein